MAAAFALGAASEAGMVSKTSAHDCVTVGGTCILQGVLCLPQIHGGDVTWGPCGGSYVAGPSLDAFGRSEASPVSYLFLPGSPFSLKALNLRRGVVGRNVTFVLLASLLLSLRGCLQTRAATAR
jgi:hypothetical protein